MKLTLVLLLVLGLSLCLAQDTNNTKRARPLVNKTDGNITHPHHPRHPPHPRHHKQNETAPAMAEPEAEAEPEATNTTDDAAEEAARLLGGKRNARHHEQKGHKGHKAPGKHLRGHHQKPPAAEANNATKPAEPEENNESEEAQISEEESVVAEQGEDAEEELARLLADQKVRKNKKGAPRRGRRNGGRGNKRNQPHAVKPEEEFGENAEGVIGGEDAEDIESELRRLLPQTHQGNANKKPAHAKKGGRPQWKKPQVKPELKPEDFDFFGEHQIFGEDAFENGEDFGFGWNHHHKKH